MSLTPHFGLSALGPGESVSNDGYKYTKGDRLLIDSLFYRLFRRRPDGVALSTSNPVDPLIYELSTTGGNIGPGLVARYKYTYVDQYGGETQPSPEMYVTTPPPISRPNLPSLTVESVGGTLFAGTYYYSVSAYVGVSTSETLPGTQAIITIPTGATNQVIIDLPTLPSGATGFNIYRRGPGEITSYFLETVISSGATPITSYTDDGGASSNRTASNVNLTNVTNSITLTVPEDIPEDYTWRLYRTFIGTDYSASYLADVVEETEDDSGIITTTYVDTGLSTQIGSPPSFNFEIPTYDKINLVTETTGNLPLERTSGTLPIASFPTNVGNVISQDTVTLSVPGLVSTGVKSVTWVSDYDVAQIMGTRAWLGNGYTPASTAIIVDIEYWNTAIATPAWQTIFGSTARRPQIAVANTFGIEYATTNADHRKFAKGRRFRLNVAQAGGGATPTDYDLTVQLTMYTQGSLTTFTFDA